MIAEAEQAHLNVTIPEGCNFSFKLIVRVGGAQGPVDGLHCQLMTNKPRFVHSALLVLLLSQAHRVFSPPVVELPFGTVDVPALLECKLPEIGTKKGFAHRSKHVMKLVVSDVPKS